MKKLGEVEPKVIPLNLPLGLELALDPNIDLETLTQTSNVKVPDT